MLRHVRVQMPKWHGSNVPLGGGRRSEEVDGPEERAGVQDRSIGFR